MMYTEGGYRATRRVYVEPQWRKMKVNDAVLFWSTGTAVLTTAISGVTWSVIGLLKATVSGAVGMALGYSGSKALADKMDIEDGKDDELIIFYIKGHYTTETNPYPPNSYQGAMF